MICEYTCSCGQKKWTEVREKRLARSYIHHIHEFREDCHVDNNAQQCRIGLFQDQHQIVFCVF